MGFSQSAALARTPEDDLGDLIASCAQGIESALASLYDRTAGQVNGLAVRILGDREAAEEVTIDVYMQVWRSAAGYDPQRGSPLAWLLTLARSRAIDRLRSSATPNRLTDPLHSALSLASAEPGPEADSLLAQRRHLVGAAMARLGAQQRQAIQLAFFSGMSHSEIAEHLGQPLGTIKTRVRTGMIRLREILGAAGREIL